ncbi:hypothetical protein [Streptomyces sp900105755]|uniref:Uncharacterized protein n=1 Tax=Streptomyces sp. 900105755 TaxID=3154389 RepID=A0ABV1TMJ9_9ACTN
MTERLVSEQGTAQPSGSPVTVLVRAVRGYVVGYDGHGASLLRVLRIVRGTRRGGSLDMPLVVAVGVTEAVPLTGTLDRACARAVSRAGPVGGAGAVSLAGAVVVPLAGALIGRFPVPGRWSGLPGLRPGVRRGSPG